MLPLNNEEIEQIWQNLVYPPKQVKINSLELTLKTIHTFESRGQIDFGGGEYEESKQQKIVPELEDDPKYGWWILDKGEYLIEYNEILSNSNYFAIVFPHERLQMTGCYHSPFLANPQNSDNRISLKSLLSVSTDGVRIKENARISTALTYRI